VGKLLSRAALVAAVGMALAGALAVPAGASTRASAHIVATRAQSSFLAKTPKDKIVGQGKKAVYSPTALTAAEDISGGACGETTPPKSFTLRNTGTAAANVTYEGAVVFSLPAGDTEDLCISGGAAGDTLVLGLSNASGSKTYASTLTVTTSD